MALATGPVSGTALAADPVSGMALATGPSEYTLPRQNRRLAPCRSRTAQYQPVMQIVLFQPEIPYNAGSVGRTCVAVGAKLWLVRPLGFQLDDRHLRRAGLDYWQHLDWEAVDDWDTLLDRVPARRLWYFSKKASKSYLDAQFSAEDVLVFGSESQGLPQSILQTHEDRCLRIPIHENPRSLNLSVSVAVVAFEVKRQASAQE